MTEKDKRANDGLIEVLDLIDRYELLKNLQSEEGVEIIEGLERHANRKNHYFGCTKIVPQLGCNCGRDMANKFLADPSSP
jgi:hypothetical protein